MRVGDFVSDFLYSEEIAEIEKTLGRMKSKETVHESARKLAARMRPEARNELLRRYRVEEE